MTSEMLLHLAVVNLEALWPNYPAQDKRRLIRIQLTQAETRREDLPEGSWSV